MFEYRDGDDTRPATGTAIGPTLYVPRIMEHVRRLSKQLFGGQYRLEIAAALTEGEVVTLTTFAATVGAPPSVSSVAKELATLEHVGLLRRLPPVAGMRSVYLEPVSTPFWDACRQLVRMATDVEAATTDSASA
jgi:hypothetical protein